MTVNVTRDAINVREKLAELDKPTGIAGEAMLRAETVQEQQALIGVGRRNLIINGAMQVAQRGTSFTPSSASYTLDRWRCAFNNSAPTITKETGSTFGTKRTHLKLVTGATSTYSYVAQCIEDIAQFDGKTITVSFDYKSDNSFNCSFEYHFGSGGSASLYDKHANLIPASPIVKHTSVTITLDDISSKTIGAANTSHLDVLFNMTANNKTLEITNVQLELGKVATPFEHRSYGEELALCQRYYKEYGAITLCGYFSAAAREPFHFQQAMRAAPSVDLGTIFDAAGADRTSITNATSITQDSFLLVTTSSLTTSRLHSSNLKLNAEL